MTYKSRQVLWERKSQTELGIFLLIMMFSWILFLDT